VGPLLQVFGLAAQSANPGEYCGAVAAGPEQAEASSPTVAMTTRLVSLLDAGMSPPTGKQAALCRQTA